MSPTLPPGASSPMYGNHLKTPDSSNQYDTVFQGLQSPDQQPSQLGTASPRDWSGEDHQQGHSPDESADLRSRKGVYWYTSGLFGFKERWSLLLCFVFAGALLGFCLSRLMMLSPHKARYETVPGEWFWYRRDGFKPIFFIHVYLTIFAGLMAGPQFFPSMRQKNILLHRINGYLVLGLLIPGIVTGGVVARHSFGGEPITQAAFYTIGIAIVGAGVMGYINVRRQRIEQHRKWMIRMIVYLGTVITARVISAIARPIISTSAARYQALWSCAELKFLEEQGQGNPNFNIDYPTCVNNSDPWNTFVPVTPSTNRLPVNLGTAFRLTFGMALWVSLVIHMAGCEFYLQASESKNRMRQGYILQRLPNSDSREKGLGNGH